MNVTLRDSKARLSELVEKASGGEEIVITVRGRPMARLCPIDAEPKFSGGEWVRELTALQERYRTSRDKVTPSERIVGKLREDRL